jgi:uncharacterized protein YjbI with pentapeptide repeats
VSAWLDISGAVLKDVDLKGANLIGIDLTMVALSGAILD